MEPGRKDMGYGFLLVWGHVDTKSIPGYFLQIVFFRDFWGSILRDPHKRVESSD